jgi:Tfp pilus assembly protein PilX
MNKAIFLAAALLIAPLPAMSEQAQQSQDQSQDRQSTALDRDRTMDRDSERGGREDLLERLSRSDLKDRLSAAVQRIEGACGEEIEQFCGDVTPGGGRIASCMDAYSDQVSRSCQSALRKAVNRVQQAVANITDTCMSAVQQQCGDADNMKQCLQQKNASFPQSCQTIVAVVQQGRQALASRSQGQGEQPQAEAGQEQGSRDTAQAQGDQGMGRLRGLPAFSSDGKNLGQIIQAERGPDGKIQSVQIQVGRLLGLGEKTITIDGAKLEQLADRVRVMMNSDQIRTLPDTKGQGGSTQR